MMAQEQTPRSHGRGRPEGDDKPRHDRVAHEFIEPGRLESRGWLGGVAQVPGNLGQAEQLEMADHESRQENDQKLDPE
jgi:hypothetical protein